MSSQHRPRTTNMSSNITSISPTALIRRLVEMLPALCKTIHLLGNTQSTVSMMLIDILLAQMLDLNESMLSNLKRVVAEEEVNRDIWSRLDDLGVEFKATSAQERSTIYIWWFSEYRIVLSSGGRPGTMYQNNPIVSSGEGTLPTLSAHPSSQQAYRHTPDSLC